MAKLILHIGSHKTGTTAIQQTLARNRAILRCNGLVYPKFAMPQDPPITAALRRRWKRLTHAGVPLYASRISDGHHGLLTDWITLPKHYRTARPPTELMDQLCKDHADSDRTVFLSSEEFSRAKSKDNPNGPDLASMRKQLDRFDEVRVICMLRHQVPFLQSVYTEVSRKAVPPPIPHLVERAITGGISSGIFMDYNLLLDRLEAAFPGDRLLFMDYESACGHADGILGAVLHAAGFPSLSREIKTSGIGLANASDPPLAVWMGNLVAMPQTAPPALKLQIIRLLHEDFGEDRKTTLFLRSEIERLRSHFAPLNRSLEGRINRSQSQNGNTFRLSEKSFDDMVHRDDINQRHWLALSRTLHRITTPQ